ncbi:iron-sulfur cluster biosynthesis family protein [Fictibacillus sp. Mic-4]|uniref:HesB/YadR/YfhF family protein n=1 Tax=Fictibacillus sp. Mic-4 TaxID=3132826 RepID=UPI003CED6651
MTFSMTESVIKLYKEIELNAGEALRLFVRYAGGTNNGGFSLGVSPDEPREGDYVQEMNGLRFIVRPDDQWLINNMKLDYDDKNDQFICEIPALG